MFRNRINTQKPTDELYTRFKAAFPNLRHNPLFSQSISCPQPDSGISNAATFNAQCPTTVPQTTTTFDKDIVEILADKGTDDRKDEMVTEVIPINACNKSEDVLSKDFSDFDTWGLSGLGFTPSFLDPNSNAFDAFATQVPGYYTPNSGGLRPLFHSIHAGDLHTPYLQFGLGTPTSMPTSDGAKPFVLAQGVRPVNAPSRPDLQEQYGIRPLGLQDDSHLSTTVYDQQTQSQALSLNDLQAMMGNPTRMINQMDIKMDLDIGALTDSMLMPKCVTDIGSLQVQNKTHRLAERFRYHATLNAPTAMVGHEDEIPITYLNKGQTYTLRIKDTDPRPAGPVSYRTFVRVSFEDEEQRRRPEMCWQLWKEGRGIVESHRRGGKLQAVEFVESAYKNMDQPNVQMELESASFDGFCVRWTHTADFGNGLLECPIPVRFNFLSTDFSHSKGVKGVPVRLCAKTELLGPTVDAQIPEICHCKVKLFRDHGAERKLANDVAHVKKMIEKVNQQITQNETVLPKELGKRKRTSGGIESQRPAKLSKHERTWSTSASISPITKINGDEDLHEKLIEMKKMFSSTKTFSVLFLRGAVEDDPDTFAVRLVGEPINLLRIDTKMDDLSRPWIDSSTQSSMIISPTPSGRSEPCLERRDSTLQFLGMSPADSGHEWKQTNHMQDLGLPETRSASPQNYASPSEQTLRVPVIQNTGHLQGYIEATGVDVNYKPPPGRLEKPVACIYVQFISDRDSSSDKYYRSVYLTQRTLDNFVSSICTRFSINQPTIFETVRCKDGQRLIQLDDNDILELPEGQHMQAMLVSHSTPDNEGLEPHDPSQVQVRHELRLLY